MKLERTGVSTVINPILIAITIANTYFIINGNKTIVAYLLLAFLVLSLLSRIFSFTIEIKDEKLNFNHVAKIPLDEIKNVYVGEFAYIESFEEKDQLSIKEYKRKELAPFINSNSLLSFNAGKQMYFVNANYFKKDKLNDLLTLLEAKNMQINKQVQ